MPKTWNQFVTDYATTHSLSRKEAMNKARASWARYKLAHPKQSAIPGLKKREDVIDWPPPKPKKRKGGSTVAPTTIHRVNHRGGAIKLPSVTEIIRKKHYAKRRSKKQTIYQDSAYNALAHKTGIHHI